MQIHPEQRKSISLLVLLMPNIRLMSYSGLFIHRIANDFYTFKMLMSCLHLILITFQYCCIVVNTVMTANDVAELTSNLITLLFFTHGITKFIYLGLHHRQFIRTLKAWNDKNVHPLFVASSDSCYQIAFRKIRKLLILVTIATALSASAWIVITFFGESRKIVLSIETNSTFSIDIPRLPIYSYYPWNIENNFLYILTFIYQCYYIIFSMIHGNMCDVLFCSWLIFSCEQLQYLKNNIKQLIQLSVSMDSNSASKSSSLLLANISNSKQNYDDDNNLSYIYHNTADWALLKRRAPIVFDNLASNPKNLPSEQQEMTLRSTIKYWVEHHKQIVKLVEAIGETYGVALLLHMLTSTVQLTLLAYQATKITNIDVYGLSVIGYLMYSLAQIFHFCIFGNRLIEESSSVMDAVYSCEWYDGSEQAKTFVQIVCQQCQKALSISGAKFFTISLDLFASVLGAVVTYFMVLIQLK